MRRFLSVVGSVGLLAVAGIGSAAAGSFYHSTTGVKMDGSYKFEKDSVNQGAFHFWGTLEDTLKDGHAGKQQVRVHGYGYNTWYADVDKNKYLNQYVWDPATQRTTYARAKVCRDRGSLRPDNCSTEKCYDR